MFQDIRSLLPKITQKSEIKKKIGNTKIIEAFDKIKNKILPEKESKKIKSLYIKEGILTALSISEKAIKKLKEQEKKIINEINYENEKNIIKKIKYIGITAESSFKNNPINTDFLT